MRPMNTPHITVFGIPNCDTVKKARQWLADHGLDYQFHDFKKQGVPAELLPAWQKAAGWEPLVNRKGTTWRKLDTATQASVTDAASAQALMLAQASVSKRTSVQGSAETADISVGFDPEAWSQRI